jgi:YbbR domain-containing protein
VALALWTVISYPNLGIVQRSFIVPVQFSNVPENIVADNVKPQEIVVTISGRSQDFQLLDPLTFNISIDLNDIKAIGNQRIILSNKNIKLPPALSLDRLEPQEVKFRLNDKYCHMLSRFR